MIKYLFPLLLLPLASCLSRQPESLPTKQTVTEPSIVRPEFSADSAFSYVERQCAFGPRVPNSNSKKQCALYLEEKLRSFGAIVDRQEYTALSYDDKTLNGINIIGRIHPEIDKRIVLFSHWDSRPFCDRDEEAHWYEPVMGANDGASGVGVILEIVRQLKLKNDSIGVDVVFLDLEDHGQPAFEKQEKRDSWCLGSQYLAKKPYYKTKPRMGILLDMVGGADPFFGFDEVSSFYAQSYLSECWTVAHSLGYGAHFVPGRSGSIEDDHYYINSKAHIPTIDIIDYKPSRGFPSMWHTRKDTPENIDKKSLQMVGEVLLAYLRK